MLAALAPFACADAPAPSANCPAAAAAPGTGLGAGVDYDRYDGRLTTTVAGQSLTEPRPLAVHAEPGRPSTLRFGLSSGPPESDCLIVAAGPVVSAGVCQDLTDPAGLDYVEIKQGGTLDVSSDAVRLDFDVTVHHLTSPDLGADSGGAASGGRAVLAHMHFDGTRRWPPPKAGTQPVAPPALKMTFDARKDFLDAPFPNDTRVDPQTNAIDLGDFPEPAPPGRWYDLVGRAKFAVLRNIFDILKEMPDKRGFSLASAIFFQSTAPLEQPKPPNVEGIWQGLDDSFVLAPVLPVKDPRTPDRKWQLAYAHPIKVQFRADAGSLAPEDTLAILPLQGRPLLENTVYVAWVRKGLGGPSGALQAAPAMQRLSGITEADPKGLPGSYVAAVAAMRDHGVKPEELAALTVFTTGAPTADLKTLFTRTAPPRLPPFRLSEKHDDYCIYESSVKMPEYQSGAPPHQVGDGVLTLLVKALLGVTFQHVTGGGDIPAGASSHDSQDGRVVLTVPLHEAMPAKGWPSAVYVRAGAGLDATGAPLVDRGRTLPPGDVVSGCLPPKKGAAASPANQLCGGGPGYEFARAGLVGITIDGPQTGSRLVGGDGEFGGLVDACKIDPKYGEDNAMFDVCNPRAILDNIRQSALEIALIPAMLDQPLRFEGDKNDDACHLAGARFDASRAALMGHSMGATVAPLALSLQPRYKAVVLSGANGSYIENILAKEMPSPLAAQLEQLFGLDYCLDEFSLLSSLFQWAEEPSDPIVYEPALFADVDSPAVAAGASRRLPPDVLMIQGIGDHYIPPPVANVSSMGLRLDLVGPELDVERPARCVPDPEAAVPLCKRKPRYPVTEVVPLLRYVDAGVVPYPPRGPVTRNRDHGTGTRGLVQYERDQSCRQDGHEVAYEIAQARWQYRCFLASFARGQAKIWAPPPHAVLDDTLEIDAPCPEP